MPNKQPRNPAQIKCWWVKFMGKCSQEVGGKTREPHNKSSFAACLFCFSAGTDLCLKSPKWIIEPRCSNCRGGTPWPPAVENTHFIREMGGHGVPPLQLQPERPDF